MTAETQLGLLGDGFEMVVQCGMSDSGFYSAFLYIKNNHKLEQKRKMCIFAGIFFLNLYSVCFSALAC